MSIVKGLLSMMGTTLSVKSEYGKGSVFSFELEQEIINGDPVGDFVQKAHDKTNAGGKDSHISAPDAMVLVVDDSIMNLKVAKGLMKRNGIVPHEAKSGAEAIEKMSATAYDLVLLDHMMPGMDGVETLHNLRAMEDNPNLDTPVICLTANAISGAREEYIEAGFDDYLSKPIDPAGLEEILKKYLPAKKISED